jgi:hypothetical protein
LYVRDLNTGELRDRIAWQGPVESGNGCFATDAWIVLALSSAVALVSRGRTPAESVLLPTAAAAIDRYRRCVALYGDDASLTLLDVGARAASPRNASSV